MSKFPYKLNRAHGDIAAGTQVHCSRNADRDIVCTTEDGRSVVLSAALYCLMGEGVESQLWWRAAVKGLARVSGRSEEYVVPELRNLLYALQVNAGAARNNMPWSERASTLDWMLAKSEEIMKMTTWFMTMNKRGWRLPR